MVTNAVELMAPQPAQLKGLAATSYIMYVLQACCLAAHLSLQASLGLLGAAGRLAAQAYTFARNEQKNSRAKAGTSRNALPPTAKSARRASTSAGHQPEACPTAQSGTGSLPGATKACPTAQSGTGSPSGTTGVRPAAQSPRPPRLGRLHAAGGQRNGAVLGAWRMLPSVLDLDIVQMLAARCRLVRCLQSQRRSAH